jgi:hypothetical protein
MQFALDDYSEQSHDFQNGFLCRIDTTLRDACVHVCSMKRNIRSISRGCAVADHVCTAVVARSFSFQNIVLAF